MVHMQGAAEGPCLDSCSHQESLQQTKPPQRTPERGRGSSVSYPHAHSQSRLVQPGACLGDFAAIVADIWQATILTLAL